MISTFKKKIKQQFLKDFFALFFGSGAVHLLSFLTFPILAKLYTPENFGVFALFMAISSLVTTVITGRYELAIAIPHEDKEAANIAVLAVFLSFTGSIILTIIIFLTQKKFSQYTGNVFPFYFFCVFPFYFFIISFYRTIDYWSFRKEYYKQISIYRIFEKFFIVVLQIALPFIFYFDYKLIIFGEIIGKTLSCLLVVYILKNDFKKIKSSINFKYIISLSRIYINFPKFYVASYLFTAVNLQIPIFMIGLFFGNTVVGIFSLTERFLRAPLILFGSNVHDLFRQKLASASPFNFQSIFLNTFYLLTIVGVLIFIPLYFFIPFIFSFLFTSEWGESGLYAQIMIPMIFFSFLSNSLSPVLLIFKKQKIQFILELISLLLTFFCFMMSIYIKDIKSILLFFSMTMSVFYSINLLIYYCIASTPSKEVRGDKPVVVISK